MDLAVDIIKHGNSRQPERFEREKLHNSIVSACLAVRSPIGQAELIANNVCEAVIDWLQQRPEVTGQDIRTVTTRHLKNYHPDAAYLYEQHHMII